MDNAGPFFWLCIQSWAFYSSIIWLCWTYWRSVGIDYLVLPALWLLGLYCIWFAAGAGLLFPAAAAIVAAGLAIISWRTIIRATARASGNFIPKLVITLLAVMAFDLLTEHAPVYVVTAIGGRYAVLLAVSAMLAVSIAWLRLAGGTTRLRVGFDARWAIKFWNIEPERSPMLLLWSLMAAWLLTLATPLTSTGALSSSIFRDSLMAILAARLIGSRPVGMIIIVGGVVGILRSLAGIVFDSATTLALMDATLLVALFLFVGASSPHAAWESGRGD